MRQVVPRNFNRTPIHHTQISIIKARILPSQVRWDHQEGSPQQPTRALTVEVVNRRLRKAKEESRKRHNRMQEANLTRNVRRNEAEQIGQSQILVYTSKFIKMDEDCKIILSHFCRDEASSPVSAAHDDSVNTSTTTTPGRPHAGTSLDSSPATSDDESFRDIEAWNTVSAQMAQQMTDIEKKRQEIINGMIS